MEQTWNDSLESFLKPVIKGNTKKMNAVSSTMYCTSDNFNFTIILTNDQLTLNAYYNKRDSFMVARYELNSDKKVFSNNDEIYDNIKVKELFSYIIDFKKGKIKELPKKFKIK